MGYIIPPQRVYYSVPVPETSLEALNSTTGPGARRALETQKFCSMNLYFGLPVYTRQGKMSEELVLEMLKMGGMLYLKGKGFNWSLVSWNESLF